MEIASLESVLWVVFKLNCLAIILILIYDKVLKPYLIKSQEEPEEKIPEEIVLKYFDDSSGGDADTPSAETSSTSLLQRENKSVGDILLHNGLIDKITLLQARAHTRKYGGNLAQCLLKFGYVDERDLARCLSKQFGVPYITPESYDVTQEVINLIPPEMAQKYWLIPLDRKDDVLTVAMTDPLDGKLIHRMEQHTGMKIMPFVSIISEIVDSLEKHYNMEIRQGAVRMPPFMIDTARYSGEERRQSLRFRLPFGCRFTLDDTPMKAEVVDVSTSGFLLKCERSVDVKSILTLELNPPERVSRLPISTVVEVVRCEPHTDGHFYLAVKTLKIVKEDMNALIQYALERDLEE